MTGRLWLVRHGPTGARGMCGWTDLPADLSDGAALARLSQALPRAPVASSDLLRARQTADALAGDRPRLPPDPRLREMSFGLWEGRTHAEAEAEDPALARLLWEAPGPHAPPGGESWDALRARALPALDALLDRNAEAVAVCHFGPILAALQRARDVTAPEAMAQAIRPLSLTILRRDGAGWAVEAVDHRP